MGLHPCQARDCILFKSYIALALLVVVFGTTASHYDCCFLFASASAQRHTANLRQSHGRGLAGRPFFCIVPGGYCAGLRLCLERLNALQSVFFHSSLAIRPVKFVIVCRRGRIPTGAVSAQKSQKSNQDPGLFHARIGCQSGTVSSELHGWTPAHRGLPPGPRSVEARIWPALLCPCLEANRAMPSAKFTCNEPGKLCPCKYGAHMDMAQRSHYQSDSSNRAGPMVLERRALPAVHRSGRHYVSH